MKKLLIALSLLTSFQAFASYTIGGEIMRNGEVNLKVECAQKIHFADDCTKFRLIRRFGYSGEEVYSFDQNFIDNFDTHYKNAMKREKSYVQMENEDLTVFGKVVFGLFAYPRAAKRDAEYKSAVKKHHDYSKELIVFLSSPEFAGEVRDQETEMSLEPLMKTLKAYR